MKITLSTVWLLLSSISIAVASTSFSALSSSSSPLGRASTVHRSRHPGLFAVRGGGLFGGKDNDKKSDATATLSKESGGGGVKYPAMSQEEIEEWLEHVPVFAVTDSNGAGVVLKPENDTSVFYFFLNPIQANATLQQLKGTNEEMDLKISAFSLGKIWFNLLKSDPDKEVLLKPPGSTEEQSAKGIEYRLVPDTRDLLGARMLLTMSPEDGEKLKEGGSMTPEMAQAAIQKAMTESPKFKTTFNEIPVFTIAQMRMQKQPTEDEKEPTTLLPIYFSLQNMIGTWSKFMSQQSNPELQGVEPAINLMSLHDLVDMMQKESEIDWRHVVLVPPTPDVPSGPGGAAAAGGGAATTPAAAAADPMAQMGGATLGDDE